MSIAKSIFKLLVAPSFVLALGFLSNPAPLNAQNIPTDPQTTNPDLACSVASTQFASWFKTGAPSLNGVVTPADSLDFNDQPNCPFYQWAYQMFLWLTSPAPASYCGGGGRVFDSPVFFEVSTDSGGNRTLIPHTCNLLPLTGVTKLLNLRAAQVGAHGLPVIPAKHGGLLEIETPPTGPTGRPLVFSPSGVAIEVHSIILKNGKPVFLDKAGKEISKARPILRKQVLPTAGNRSPVVEEFKIGRVPIFVDMFGNVVEVEQGEAQTNGVLMAQTGSLIYYGIIVNDVYAYFLTGIKDQLITPTGNQIPPPPAGQFGQFPTTPSDLANITTFASAHGVTFPDPNALAVEVKTAWVEASSLSDPSSYITTTATIPTYSKTSTKWTPNGSKTVQLALVGMHVVGSTGSCIVVQFPSPCTRILTPGHPEMIWATFEHIGNTPLATYTYNSTTQNNKQIKQDTSGTWLFSKSNSTGPFNCMHMSVSGGNIILPTATSSCPAGSFTASDTLREKAWGAASDISPNPIDNSAANSNTEIISINDSVRGMIPSGDVRANYYTAGATWTISGAPPISVHSGTPGNQVGTSMLSGSTLETYQQGTDTTSTSAGSSNCFSCHTSGASTLSLATTDVSHIFNAIESLSFAPLSVGVTVLAAGKTAATHQIIVTVTNSGTGAPIAGATVQVVNDNGGATSGTTSAAGTVTLSYPHCFEVVDGGEPPSKPFVVPLTCAGSVTVPEFPVASFTAP
jgi:hypothetical protein